MATIHRILLCVIDPEEYPDDSVISAITSGTGGVRILEHDSVKTPWSDDHFLNGPLTRTQFQAWFRRASDTPPTVQTAISLIRCAPDFSGDKTWLVDNILPLLFSCSVHEAIVRIEEEDELGRDRPLLVSLVHEILKRNLQQYGDGPCSG